MNKIDILFLKELGIENPNQKQISIVENLSDVDKSIPIIFAGLNEGKSYARIATQIGRTKQCIRMRIVRLKKNGNKVFPVKPKT